MKALSPARVAAALLITIPGFAAPGLNMDQAEPGTRRITAFFDDSVRAPDLASIRVEGYSVEHAVFLEESDTLILSPMLWDLTMPGFPRVLKRDASDSANILLETPRDWAPWPGVILADTAGGGLLVKVIETWPAGDGMPAQYWVKTQPAFLNEAVLDGEIRFRMRLDLNALPPDFHVRTDLSGIDSGAGELEAVLGRAGILFQPLISGGMRVRNGLLETVAINLQGHLEVSGEFTASLHGRGRFLHEEILPDRREFSVPLGHGLLLRVREEFALRVEADAWGEELTGRLSARVRQAVTADLGYRHGGGWEPSAEAREASQETPEVTVHGAGSFRFSLEPRLEISLGGQPGPVIAFSPSVRIAGNAPSLLDSAAPGPSAGGMAWLRSALFLRAPALSQNSDPRKDFLLFNRERIWVSPPREGWASAQSGDSSSVVLHCQTEPPADYFMVQRRTDSGSWETVLPRVVGPRIRVNGLEPGREHRFRVFGVNARGTGPAFPPEGLAYFAPQPIPSSPLPSPQPQPDSAAGDSLRLSWTLPPPGIRGDGAFNVYLGNGDSLQLIAQSLRDTSLWVPKLDSGWSYVWRVEYMEGSRVGASPARSFTFHPPGNPAAPAPSPRAEEGAMAFIPAGKFRRSDGGTVSIAAFHLQKYEVLQKDFRSAAGANPSFHVGDSLPVERVTWDEAAHYCRETGGRLPTEAEWEYAARAGSAGRFYWGNAPASEYARFRANSGNHSWPPGSVKPNAFGLYDMSGNVCEWVQDWYGAVSRDGLANPKGAAAGEAKVIRGASWYSEIRSLGLSVRFSNRPGFRNYKVGFRCARDAAPPETVAGSRP